MPICELPHIGHPHYLIYVVLDLLDDHLRVFSLASKMIFKLLYLRAEAAVLKLIHKDKDELFSKIELKWYLEELSKHNSPVHDFASNRYCEVFHFNDAIGMQNRLFRAQRKEGK